MVTSARTWRRTARTAVYVVTILASVAFIGWIIHRADTVTLRLVATGLLGIVGISVLGYTAENVVQRIKFHIGATGVDAEIGDDK